MPHFVIKRRSQKRGATYYSDTLTHEILSDVCMRVTGQTEFTLEFDDEGYNKGRLAILEHDDNITYISFSETGEIGARNSFFQSLTTALVSYYREENENKNICFYFLPLDGNVETNYFRFMYRLMRTAGVVFLNADTQLDQEIEPFHTIDDLIAARHINRSRNRSNNSTYITKSVRGRVEIYGKTYGASKKETALLCIVASHLTTSEIDLFEICEQNLTELPAPDLAVIESLQNINVIPTTTFMDRNSLLNNPSFRSPRFTYNLLQKLGPKKCSLCDCDIPELIEGAHIWPVSDIRNSQLLSDEEKFSHAINEDNGIWLCENHHGLIDGNILVINDEGELAYKTTLSDTSIQFIKDITTSPQIEEDIATETFLQYLTRRNSLIDEEQYTLITNDAN